MPDCSYPNIKPSLLYSYSPLLDHAFAFQKFQRHQRIEEVPNTARMQTELVAQLCPGHLFSAECGKHFELHRREQDFRAPKTKSSIKNT
jgi:hypothetical protein